VGAFVVGPVDSDEMEESEGGELLPYWEVSESPSQELASDRAPYSRSRRKDSQRSLSAPGSYPVGVLGQT
jgi:hypothetical protein